MDREIPTFEWEGSSIGADLSDRPVYIVQSSDSDISGIVSTVQEYGGSILDYIPENSLLVRFPFNAPGDLILNSIDGVRWFGIMPDLWRISPEILSVEPTSLLNLRFFLLMTLAHQNWYLWRKNFPHYQLLRGPMRNVTHGSVQLGTFNLHGSPFFQQIGEFYTFRLKIPPLSIIAMQGIFPGLTRHSKCHPQLDGTGEVIAISDTGLDEDHGDFDGRIRSVYSQFGPDNDNSDLLNGHGTHVVATLLGDGSGDPSTAGVAPGSTFHMYTHQSQSGFFGIYGSLYGLFTHSWNQNARIHTNSWGTSNLGNYSQTSSNVDDFVHDYPGYMVLFSAGDFGPGTDQGITPPGTSKNALTVGASTTGSLGSSPPGEVATFSSTGLTNDGRIKPEIVAPGILVCSARAAEATLIQGETCSTATHDDGTTRCTSQ